MPMMSKIFMLLVLIPVINRMKLKWLLLVPLFSLNGCGYLMSQVERPTYEVTQKYDNIEIREYPPQLVAAVIVKGERKEALNQGFRKLADFIFGNNSVNQEVAMTAPVMQQESAKIAMTAPVTQQASGSAWVVQFIMPSEYTLVTLPKPNNSEIKIIEIPARRFIAIEFSGLNRKGNLDRHQALLDSYIKEEQIQTAGPLMSAFYNPPWTLPFLRRNELMYELKERNH